MSSEMMFADAIIIQNVDDEDVRNLNFIACTTPYIQWCLQLVNKLTVLFDEKGTHF